jgi:hypothetical protein
MRRALKTTALMFQNHPNKSKILFIVLPLAREWLHTFPDIAIDI